MTALVGVRQARPDFFCRTVRPFLLLRTEWWIKRATDVDRGAFVAHADGTCEVNFEKVRSAVRDLDHDLLTLKATGDYGGAKKMLDECGVLRPEMAAALSRLKDVPTGIEPMFVPPGKLSPW